MTTTYTKNLRLAKPDFRSPDWAQAFQDDMDALDAAFLTAAQDVILWEVGTIFSIGQIAYDVVTNPTTFWICNVPHTAAGTFATERSGHPTYWTSYSFGIQPRGAWANDTNYNRNDISYDSVRGITGICNTAHTSNHAGSIVDDAAFWDFIVNLPTTFTAAATSYDPTSSGLPATDVQQAIDAVNDNVAGAYVSSNIAYDPGVSGLTSTNVKTAIDEVVVAIAANTAAIAANTASIITGLISTGFLQWRPTSEVLTGWILANALTIGDSLSGAIGRANGDTQPAFIWHWNNFSNTECPVSGGRGISAVADYAAHKTIVTLDMRGTGITGVETMGGSVTTRLSGVPVTAGGVSVSGSTIGENVHSLTGPELAAHNHAVFLNDNGHVHGVTQNANVQNGGSSVAAGGNPNITSGGAATITVNSAVTGITVRDASGGGGTANQTAATGSSTAHNTVARSRTGNWWIKL